MFYKTNYAAPVFPIIMKTTTINDLIYDHRRKFFRTKFYTWKSDQDFWWKNCLRTGGEKIMYVVIYYRLFTIEIYWFYSFANDFSTRNLAPIETSRVLLQKRPLILSNTYRIPILYYTLLLTDIYLDLMCRYGG